MYLSIALFGDVERVGFISFRNYSFSNSSSRFGFCRGKINIVKEITKK